MYSDWTWQNNCPNCPGAQPKYSLWITLIREERIHTTHCLLCTWMLFLPIVNVGFCKMDFILDWQEWTLSLIDKILLASKMCQSRHVWNWSFAKEKQQNNEDVPISTRFELILCQGKTTKQHHGFEFLLCHAYIVLALAYTSK
jgi:hypothetical protein